MYTFMYIYIYIYIYIYMYINTYTCKKRDRQREISWGGERGWKSARMLHTHACIHTFCWCSGERVCMHYADTRMHAHVCTGHSRDDTLYTTIRCTTPQQTATHRNTPQHTGPSAQRCMLTAKQPATFWRFHKRNIHIKHPTKPGPTAQRQTTHPRIHTHTQTHTPTWTHNTRSKCLSEFKKIHTLPHTTTHRTIISTYVSSYTCICTNTYT